MCHTSKDKNKVFRAIVVATYVTVWQYSVNIQNKLCFKKKFESENKHGLKISGKLQIGNQIILCATENTLFWYWNKRISCFYFCMAINLSPTEQIGTIFKSIFSCWLYSFPMLSAHYTFPVFCSQHLDALLQAFCNPASQRALLLVSRSANLNTSLLRQSNNETHMYVLAHNLSNTSLAHYNWFLQSGVFIGACIHT